MSERDDQAALRQEIKRLRAVIAELKPGLTGLLRQRGFQPWKKEPAADLVIPPPNFLDAYYHLLLKYSFRIFLRDVIKYQNGFTLPLVSRFSPPATTRPYLDQLLTFGLVTGNDQLGYCLTKRPITSFGATLEWLVAQIFTREFDAETLWGVKFRRSGVGGDYDLLAKIDGSILYMEIKSSPPSRVTNSEIAAFLNRVEDLHPGLAIFFMDTELRLKDKIVPMFEEELLRRSAWPQPVRRLIKEIFAIDNHIFLMNAKGRIINNIVEVLEHYFRNRRIEQ